MRSEHFSQQYETMLGLCVDCDFHVHQSTEIMSHGQNIIGVGFLYRMDSSVSEALQYTSDTYVVGQCGLPSGKHIGFSLAYLLESCQSLCHLKDRSIKHQ